jgi:hypothetical protein
MVNSLHNLALRRAFSVAGGTQSVDAQESDVDTLMVSLTRENKSLTRGKLI